MSKPKTLIRNIDKSYKHVNARSWKIYSVNHPEVPNGISSLYSRKGWIAFNADESDLDSVTDYLYSSCLPGIVSELDQQKVLVKNIMTGDMFEESLTLPYSCSVASEAFWSA